MNANQRVGIHLKLFSLFMFINKMKTLELANHLSLFYQEFIKANAKTYENGFIPFV